MRERHVATTLNLKELFQVIKKYIFHLWLDHDRSIENMWSSMVFIGIGGPSSILKTRISGIYSQPLRSKITEGEVSNFQNPPLM